MISSMMKCFTRALLAAFFTALLPGFNLALAQGGRDLEVPEVRVIGVTPLPASGIDVDRFAGNAQSISAGDSAHLHSLEVSDTLHKLSSSFNVNSTQNNPYQNDVYYRGFLVSPLVGTANGLSVYLDGMRINEGFGNTINWDLIPQSAISAIDVVPGSNPLFGRNTLGGSLSMRTKSGFSHPGTRIEAGYGSFDRRSIDLEHGGSVGAMDWYLNASGVNEDGWREYSPSRVRQFFGKFGWESERTDIDLSLARIDNDLTGNGLAPEGLLQIDPESVHSYPDYTGNEVDYFNATLSHDINASLQLAGNAYRRSFERRTLNGDAEIECSSEDDDTGEEKGVFFDNNDDDRTPIHPELCDTEKLETALASGQLREFYLADEDEAERLDANSDLSDLELEREAEGEERTTLTRTDTVGGGLQLSHQGSLGGRDNHIIIGFAYERHKTKFQQSEGEGALNAAELVSGTKGVGIIDVEEKETEVDIRTEENSYGFYVTDSFMLTDTLTLTASARYQHSKLEIRNHAELEEDEEDKLSGEHSFDRINPAAGLSWNPMPELNLFAAYSEGFRVPTAAELTCADPDDPCNLPNAFVADPPLDAVVARTYEFGARGTIDMMAELRWNLAFFRTDLADDLFFTHTTTTGGGYFQNIGDTRRQGMEFGVEGDYRDLSFYLNYGYLQATVEDNVRLSTVTHFAGTNVEAGDHLPGIPDHSLRFGASYQLLPNWMAGLDVRYSSGVYLRGDESNELDTLSGYTVMDFNSVVTLSSYIDIWVEVENVFDTEYETAGARAWNALPQSQGKDEIAVENFHAPGAPRSAWAGLRIRF